MDWDTLKRMLGAAAVAGAPTVATPQEQPQEQPQVRVQPGLNAPVPKRKPRPSETLTTPQLMYLMKKYPWLFRPSEGQGKERGA